MRIRNFNYFERVTCIHRGIYSQIRQGLTFDQSLVLILESFWQFPEETNVVNNLVVLAEIMNIELIVKDKLENRTIQLYKDLMLKARNEDLGHFMSDYEIEVYEESVEVLNDLLDLSY